MLNIQIALEYHFWYNLHAKSL